MAHDAGRVDIAIVGGGPAGLTGALYLARFRRSVLVIDAGEGRARRIPRARNLAGHPDGVEGAALVAAMREQAERHGARLRRGRVDALERSAHGYALRWDGGSVEARLVLMASGASDVEPPLPGRDQALAEGALRYCPVCDGYEVIDRRVGLLADSTRDFAEALYLRHFTPHLTVFRVSPAVQFDAGQRAQLQAAGIALAEAPVDALRRTDAGVTVHHGGTTTELDALYSALGLVVHSDLAAALGARCASDGTLLTNHHQQTGLPGLYAAGDVAKGLNQISVAMGDAAIAAAAMHRALLDADAEAARN